MIAFLNRLGIPTVRRTLYAVLTILIACLVFPVLGGMAVDRVLNEGTVDDCAAEVIAVRRARRELTGESFSDQDNDYTVTWLALRRRSVTLRRRCKADPQVGAAAVREDERVRISVAAYRVQQNQR
jgi:hypothetical protein